MKNGCWKEDVKQVKTTQIVKNGLNIFSIKLNLKTKILYEYKSHDLNQEKKAYLLIR